MKLMFTALLSTLLLSLSLCAQSKSNHLPLKSDREDDGLKGAVKSVVYETALLKEVDGKLVEQKSPSYSVTKYNDQGEKTQVEIYRNGQLTRRDGYFLLDGERAMKSEDFAPVGDGKGEGSLKGGGPGLQGTLDPRFTFKFAYKYDAQGNREEEVWTRNNGSVARRIYRKFDAQGNLLEEKIVSPTGGQPPEMVNKRLFTQDAQGNVTKEVMESIQLVEFSDYEFDAQGNWTKRKSKTTIIYNPQKPQVNMSVVTRRITYF